MIIYIKECVTVLTGLYKKMVQFHMLESIFSSTGFQIAEMSDPTHETASLFLYKPIKTATYSHALPVTFLSCEYSDQ